MYADSLRPYYVLLPVFKDPATNQLQKPKDLLDVPLTPPQQQQQQQQQTPMVPMAAAPRRPMPARASAPPPQRQIPPQTQAQPMRPTTAAPPPGYRMASAPPTPTANQHTYMNAPTYQRQGEALWGENRGFSNNYAAMGRPPSSMMSPTTPRPTNYSNMSPSSEEFPSLPVNNNQVYPTPTMASPQQQPQRRVMRIMPQQSTRNDGGPVSMLEQ